MRARLRNEEGWVLATSITLMAIMMTVSLATFSFVDTGQKRTREQREREAGLNLTEGVLYAQGFKLAQGWPGSSTAPAIPPTTCTEGTGATAGCPNPAELAAAQGGTNFNTIDQQAAVTWVTRVRDNGGPLSDSFVTASADQPQTGTVMVQGTATTYTCGTSTVPCTWDANGDRQLWVQARSVVRNRPRNVVALLRLETVREAVPETAVTAGGINVTNNGNKTMIHAEGSQVVVRCNPSASTCTDWENGDPPQITPAPTTAASIPSFLTPQQLIRFRARAIADGRYYAGCPTDNNLWGAVVWIENCHTASYSNSSPTRPCAPRPPTVTHGGGNALDNDCVNQRDTAGMVISHCGGFSFSGGFTYVGIVYAANNSDGTCAGMGTSQRGTLPGACTANGSNGTENTLIDMSGGFGIWGALAIDGPGCLKAGSNGIQIQFLANIFSAATSYGTVGLVQNTWRELAPN